MEMQRIFFKNNLNMHSRRMSHRKSELKIQVPDLFLSVQNNSDPIISGLLLLLQWESSLSLCNESVLHKAFRHELECLKLRMKLELKKPNVDYKNQLQEANTIIPYIQKYQKLKELFSFCLILGRNEDGLERDLEKFKEYSRTSVDISESLVEYLNESTIFQMIFNHYLRIFNVNYFTAELIAYILQQYDEGLIEYDKEEEATYCSMYRFMDVDLLNNKGITFKQLVELNEKYSKRMEKLKNQNLFFFLSKSIQNEIYQRNSSHPQHQAQQTLFKTKLVNIKQLLNKIRNVHSVYESNKRPETHSHMKSNGMVVRKIVEESQNTFLAINPQKKMEGLTKEISQRCKIFWDRLLFEGLEEEELNIGNLTGFDFLKNKIVQSEILEQLNGIFESCNIISHVYNQIDPQKSELFEYHFTNLRRLICSQFLCEHYQKKSTERTSIQNSVILQTSSQKIGIVISDHNTLLIYPSAVYKLFMTIKECMRIFSDSNSLQVLLFSLKYKREYMENLAETIHSLYGIIKGKQFTCYELLMRYIEVLCSNCEKVYYESIQKQHYNENLAVLHDMSKKISIICQIIYELDPHHNVEAPLKLLVKIEENQSMMGLYSNGTTLYKKILNQIILIRNGLKLDHFYSLNQIHDIFNIIPEVKDSDTGTSSTKINKKQHLCFEDIIQILAEVSKSKFCLPELFRLFEVQLKIKLAIFRLQLFWASEEDNIFDKRGVHFQQYVKDNSHAIFTFISTHCTLKSLLQNLEQLERLVNILEKEIDRIKIIHILDQMMKKSSIKIPQFKSQLRRLHYGGILDIYNTIKMFNPLLTHKRTVREEFLRQIKLNIDTYLTIRLDQLCQWNPCELKQKQCLLDIFFIIKSLSNSITRQDCKAFQQMKRGGQPKFQLFTNRNLDRMRKQYEKLLKCTNLPELTVFYENLLVIAIYQITDIENSKDFIILKEIIKSFQLSEIFENIEKMKQIQDTKRQFGLTTKYHHIYHIMYILNSFKLVVSDQEQHFLFQKEKAQPSSTKTFKTEKIILTSTKDEKSKDWRLLQNYCLLEKLSQKTRLNIFNKIEEIENIIVNKDPLIYNVQSYSNVLNNRIYEILVKKINMEIKNNNIDNDFLIDKRKNFDENIEKLKKIILQLVINQFSFHSEEQHLGERSQIELFNEKRGYQLKVLDQNKKKKAFKSAQKKKQIQRNKKAVISPQRVQKEKVFYLEEIKKKATVSIIRETIPARKKISELQLQDKKMRDQIIWETSRLENQVVDKIHQFITMSSLDQQQSYLNFKHTVNLETIKGIQNVIEEQTKIYRQKQNQEVNNGFITEVKNCEKEVDDVSQSDRLLNVNLDAILSHMKKIRVFSAWKQTIKESDLTEKQWVNFNENVKKILHNRELVCSIKNLSLLRQHCLNEKVSCSLLNEQNTLLNEKIKKIKIEKLEQKVNQYRKKLQQ